MFRCDRGLACIDMKYFATVCAALFLRIDHRPAVMAIVAALAGAVMFGLARHAMLDDGMITLSYARTLAEHGQWGMVDGLTSNSATSVLNVLLSTGVQRAHLRRAGGALVCVQLVRVGLGDPGHICLQDRRQPF